MRLMIVGAPGERLTLAARLAERNGAGVRCAEGVTNALELLSADCGIELLVVDAALRVRDLVDALAANSSKLPVIACGSDADGTVAAEALAAGAGEFLPLPPTIEAIAALIAALARDDRDGVRAPLLPAAEEGAVGALTPPSGSPRGTR
jgi:two-component system response regulator FlrC